MSSLPGLFIRKRRQANDGLAYYTVAFVNGDDRALKIAGYRLANCRFARYSRLKSARSEAHFFSTRAR